MITVFGSLNVDLVTPVERLPGAGETVLGPGYALHPGGKGANQALAARRAGAEVILVGAVGCDGFAEIALGLLAQDGVDLAHVARVEAPTGAAFIAVDAAGSNQIVVAAGANALARAEAVEALKPGERDLLLLQREVPENECLRAAQAMRAGGGRVILNLAPAGEPAPALLALTDILIVNEHEALILAGSLGWTQTEPDAIARRIDGERGIACIVTLGSAGAVGWHGGVRRRLEAPVVDAVDTVAAGDSFVGAFAAALQAGFGFSGALQRGLAAGSLACTIAGAQPSVPRREAIEALVGRSFL
ncbi:Ribokinase [Bosea sp. 62]|uniref:ribokinase n=1 Tax=unclassified Bosea (in: a-proteobacteria) TaxID=2653178 RepID=UPI0012547109|nr:MULTISPECIES: ribokinase [unclassified Bosea (in: a-proteobacteria)]CAD5284698.1 Ribokinase [Bosea sp. 21B]CAD5287451.1 Ribokinase [Bosea sp. 46]CAD5301640.1 Ribokinase [Bosea sp. 7B]VVT51330.1 Ribokinase [Bosea sp. EC-HK365B]VXB12021.1 Ribokinase [Bosea sp. 62]